MEPDERGEASSSHSLGGDSSTARSRRSAAGYLRSPRTTRPPSSEPSPWPDRCPGQSRSHRRGRRDDARDGHPHPGSTALYLVRHAEALSAGAEPDHLRPLTEAGWRQARALAWLLVDEPVGRLLSSPALRCRQTLVPLALDRGLGIEPHPSLAEGSPLTNALRLLQQVAHLPAVLCSHADVIQELILHLDGLGVVLDEPQWPKGSTWIIDMAAGAPVRALYLPPPGRLTPL